MQFIWSHFDFIFSIIGILIGQGVFSYYWSKWNQAKMMLFGVDDSYRFRDEVTHRVFITNASNEISSNLDIITKIDQNITDMYIDMPTSEIKDLTKKIYDGGVGSDFFKLHLDRLPPGHSFYLYFRTKKDAEFQFLGVRDNGIARNQAALYQYWLLVFIVPTFIIGISLFFLGGSIETGIEYTTL